MIEDDENWLFPDKIRSERILLRYALAAFFLAGIIVGMWSHALLSR